ncbi:MAG TPA: precorrin-4 C(11)-methyltransferase [Chloroflexota bacterium]|nr:precorrin-4 C(11)-methyltransferase [Chloroflexota bacterium]
MNLGHVYFIGAGPGAPDLMTVRGQSLVRQADLVVFADSLVDPRVCEVARPGATVIGSSGLTLEEMSDRMIAAAREGQTVARLQSGDPAIYGALHEQIARLDAAGVPWTIVPGVSSAFAAAAALGVELTVPSVAQSVILTRISGRASPVPPGESLRSLAAHGTSLVLFLSIAHIYRVVRELLAGGYPPETPVAAVYRVSWPDEEIVRGTLKDIRAKVRAAKWTRQALILIGPALDSDAADGRRSRLYAGDYTHLFRQARRRQRSQAAAPRAADASNGDDRHGA